MFCLNTVFAEEIVPTVVINNGYCKDEKPYKFYQLMFYSTTKEKYTVVEKWKDFFQNDSIGKNFITIDNNSYVTSINESADLEAIANAAIAYANEKGFNPSYDSIEDGNCENKTVNVDMPEGYYAMESPKGNLATLLNVNPTIEIEEKNVYPDVKIYSKDNETLTKHMDAKIGDTINYVIKAHLSQGVNEKLYIEVFPDKGIDIDVSSITVSNNCTSDDYTIVSEDFVNSNAVFGIDFDKDFLKSVDDNDTIITISFSGKFTEPDYISSSEVIVKNSINYIYNETIGSFDSSKLYTWFFDIDSYYLNDKENPIDLPNVHYILSKTSDGKNLIPLVKLSDGLYRVATEDDSNTTTDIFNPDVDGRLIRVSGLDKGTYYIIPTEIPYGFSKENISPIEIKIEPEYVEALEQLKLKRVKIQIEYTNDKFTLPSTGGPGSTLLIIAGLALFITSLSMIITKLRIKND
mgnify:CR=1 FL=1